MKKYLAEMIGTFVLTLMGCGSAVFAGIGLGTTGYGVSTLGIAFAFGLAVVAMAYTIGGISGCHINPAITFGVWANGRMSGKDACNYMIFQVIGAIIASAVIYFLVNTGNEAGLSAIFNDTTTTGANSYLPGNVVPAFVAEFIFTFIFVLVVLGTTDSKKGAGNFAGLAIGLALVLVHIVCIPITGTSVNPARSIGPAIFACIEGNCTPISQIWLFIVAPMLGALLSSAVWKVIASDKD
ncbi:MAG: MIP family channel protein [Muribaculaceae bacterium]|nr:MIP family channel protein [Muribaculaceae bacterium]MDE6696075.1 MIP family channel protein [Muribaculaceae bacterium]